MISLIVVASFPLRFDNSLFVELKPFNGKVTLPNDLDTYTGLSIGA